MWLQTSRNMAEQIHKTPKPPHSTRDVPEHHKASAKAGATAQARPQAPTTAGKTGIPFSPRSPGATCPLWAKQSTSSFVAQATPVTQENSSIGFTNRVNPDRVSDLKKILKGV